MWKLFKTSVKITLTIWLIKSIWKDIDGGDAKLKSIIREISK
jgi:hypothetical protein